MEQDFLKIAAENQNLIKKVCNMFCRNEDDKKDLFQDILIQLWKSYPSFRMESKVTTWMYRVALNTAITRYRKCSRDNSNQSFEEHEYRLSNNDISYDRKEEIKILYKSINQLSDIERSIILLYMEEYSGEEISEIVGISPIYVRVKINRIKSKLKEMIEKEYAG